MTIDVFGARVRQARVLRRMTGSAVRQAMGWKGARQTRLEQAEVTAMAVDDVDRLAELLHFPVRFFTTPAASRVPVAQLLFRAPRSTTLAEREYLAQFSAAVGDVLDELDSRQRLPRVRLPQRMPGTGVHRAAAATREALGVGPEQPFGHLTHEVERAGVPVVVRAERMGTYSGPVKRLPEVGDPAPDKHVGYSSWTGAFNDRPLIVLRNLTGWERVRWTVAHEVGHLVLHDHGEITEGMEDEANRFASELLAPAEMIAGSLPRHITLHSLVDLKLTWGISIGALVRHLHSADLIDSTRYDMLRSQLYTRMNPQTGRTWGRTEPGWDQREPERPRLLSRWADRGFGTVHPGSLASMENLIWPRDVLAEMLQEQRTAPGTPGGTPPELVPHLQPGGSVIDFAAHRSCRQA